MDDIKLISHFLVRFSWRIIIIIPAGIILCFVVLCQLSKTKTVDISRELSRQDISSSAFQYQKESFNTDFSRELSRKGNSSSVFQEQNDLNADISREFSWLHKMAIFIKCWDVLSPLSPTKENDDQSVLLWYLVWKVCAGALFSRRISERELPQ